MKVRMKMRLIDADKLFQETEENMYNNPHSDPTHAAMHKHEHCHFLCEIYKQPEIDPVHFAGGYYCKECIYLNKEIEKVDFGWFPPTKDEGYCFKNNSVIKLNGFCSEGRKEEK